MNLIFNIIKVCIITFVVFKASTCASGKIMIKSFETRGNGAKFAFIIGNIITLFSVCLYTLAFSLIKCRIQRGHKFK